MRWRTMEGSDSFSEPEWRMSRRLLMLALAGFAAGCSARNALPPGHLPAPTVINDAKATAWLGAARPVTPVAKREPGKPFELPAGLPGGEAAAILPPRFKTDTPAGERARVIQAAYPKLAALPDEPPSDLPPLSLAALQEYAKENPSIRKAQADAAAAQGAMLQAGLHPNPTIGYQADQWQPGPKPKPLNNNGQQGAYLNQLIKTAHKLPLARQVAAYDYHNAMVALRKAEVDVASQVRTAYFAALIAREGVEINRALSRMADDVYELQLKQVAGGEAAGYEPLQLYAQAAQARNNLAQAEAARKASWRRLAAAVSKPELPIGSLDGRADAPCPDLEEAKLRDRILEQHTELLTARNNILQAQANLKLQRVTPIPDLQTNTYVQYDNVTGNNQFGVQLGIALPVFDRNQGNIQKAEAGWAAAQSSLRVTELDLQSRLAEAYGRYEANKAVAAGYRDSVLPNLSRAYRALIGRYQVEPEKVSFNDIVVAQQNLGQSLQNYLSALNAQWQAVADLATLGQLDDVPGVDR